MNDIIPYNSQLKKIARELRKKSTYAEILLWRHIKNKQLGIDFNRQRVIQNFIVDFYNAKYRLVIEIDGKSHELRDRYDTKRNDELQVYGIVTLRFTNEQVKTNINGVLIVIKKWIRKNTPRPSAETPL